MSLAFAKSGIKFEGEKDRAKVARFVEADFSKSPSLTSQAPAEEVDINKIIARVQKGQVVMTSQGEPFYGDVSEMDGLQDAIIKVQEAEELFMQYPAQVREKFENNPVKLIDFLADANNHAEAVKLGLVVPRPQPVTPPVPEQGAGSQPPAGGPTQ